MATPSVLDPTFGAAGSDRFRALLRRIVPLAVAFGSLESGLGVAQGDGPAVAVGVITLGYGAWLLGLATRLDRWGLRRIVVAAWMPILPLSVIAAALQPLAVPALTILPLVAAAATLPFEPDPSRIRRLMAVCGLSSFGVILVGAAEPIPTALPASVHDPFVVATVSAAIGVFLYLLSQFSWRLREALADAVRATADLDTAHRERLRLDRRLHEAERAASLATLAGGVAQDFNNLLTAVVGNADLALADVGPNSPIREHLEAIREAGHRAAELGRLMHTYSAGTRFTTDRLALAELVRDLRPASSRRCRRASNSPPCSIRRRRTCSATGARSKARSSTSSSTRARRSATVPASSRFVSAPRMSRHRTWNRPSVRKTSVPVGMSS